MLSHLADGCTCTGKPCSICGETLCYTAFGARAVGKLKLRSACKACEGVQRRGAYSAEKRRVAHEAHKDFDNARNRAYRIQKHDVISIKDKRRYQENITHERERRRKRYQHNKDYEQQRNRTWRLANLARAKAINKTWREAHADIMQEARDAWLAKHPGYQRQQLLRWRRAHPGRVTAQHSRRRAHKSEAGGSYTPQEWVILLDHYRHTCLRCGRSDTRLTADHVIPVSLGGTSNISNIQPLCGPCNSWKGTKTLDFRAPFTREGITE